MKKTNLVKNLNYYIMNDKGDFDLVLFVSILISISPLIFRSIIPAIQREGNNSGFQISRGYFLPIFYGVVCFFISYLIIYLKKVSKTKTSKIIFTIVLYILLLFIFFISLPLILFFSDYISIF